jgi:putative ABC transport system permease protein
MTALTAIAARSGSAIRYRVHADLRGRRIPAGSVALVVALSTLLIGLALVTFASVQAPFDRLFTQLNGAHLWVYLNAANPQTQAQIDAVIHTPNVVASTDPYEDIRGAVLLNSNKIRTEFTSFPVQQPAIGKLLITQGQTLASSDPDGVVVNQPFADANQLQVGDTLTLITPQGLAPVHIRGLSVDVNHDSSNETNSGLVYLVRPTVDRLFSTPETLIMLKIGLRLADPSATGSTIRAIAGALQIPQDQVAYEDWQSLQTDFGRTSLVTAVLLLAFGMVGLVAAGVMIITLVTGQVLAQQRDLGILKAIGFTPWQLVRALVLEYLLLGLLGALIGLGLAAAIAPPLLNTSGAALGVPISPKYDLGTGVLLLAGVLLLVAACAALPAWRAGRTRVVEVIRPGGVVPGQSRARLASWLLQGGVPLVVALGVRGMTARPLRALLVWLTLLIGVMTSFFALTLAPTVAAYTSNPALTGYYADLYVWHGLYEAQAMQRLLSSQPDVAYYYTTFQTPVKLAETSRPARVNLFCLNGDTRRIAAALESGRWYQEGADEAVLTASTLHDLGLQIGDRLPLTIELGGGKQVQITYTVVGGLPEALGDYVYVPLSSLTRHATIAADQLLDGTSYEVTVRSGVSPQTFGQRLLRQTADRVDVTVYHLGTPPGLDQALQVMVILSIVLMVMAGVSVLNAMLLSVRERFRELATFKAIGLTPGQLIRTVTDGAVALGLLALAVGIPLGWWLSSILVTALSNSFGGPTRLQIAVNWLGVVLLIPTTLLVAALGAYLPARRAARVPAGELLRDE